MSVKTKNQLKGIFVTGHIVTQQDFVDLIDSLLNQTEGDAIYLLQSALNEYYSKSETEVKFQPIEGMSNYVETSQLSDYQTRQAQVKGTFTGASEVIKHRKGHYPTVRVSINGTEQKNDAFTVVHESTDQLTITLTGVDYKTAMYILD